MNEPGLILIVGSGIGGLALGAALTRCGLPFVIFEQAPVLREVGAGVGLWPNALATLDALGVSDTLRRESLPLGVVAGANHRGEELSRIEIATLGPEFAAAACRVVLRPALLAALAEKVPGERIRPGRRCTGLAQDPQGVTLHFADGSTERGALALGADGIHSVLRPAIIDSTRDPIRYSGQTCFRGVASITAPDPGVLREVQGRGQRCAVCPVNQHTVYWWVAHNAPANQLVPPGDRSAYLLQRYAGWPHGLPEVIAATPGDTILQNDLIDRAPVHRYTKGRVALIGDAAHPTTPNLGQGANMAIDDALVLARALRDEREHGGAFARYERERLPRTRAIVERSWRFGQLTRWKNPALVSLRELMLRATPRSMLTSVLRWQILDDVGVL